MLRIFVLVCFFYVVSCHDNINAKLNSMDAKLDTIQEEVENIAAIMAESKLNCMDKKLDAIQTQVENIASGLMNPQPTGTPVPEVTDNKKPIRSKTSFSWGDNTNTIELLEASQETVDGGEEYAIQFATRGDIVAVNWLNLGRSDKLPEEGKTLLNLWDDVWESRVVFHTPVEDEDFFHVITNIQTADYNSLTGRYTNIIEMNLQFKQIKNIIQTNFSVPSLKVEPTGDLVYNEGEDIDVKITASKKDQYSFFMSYVDPFTKEYNFSRHADEGNMTEILSVEEKGEMEVSHREIKTSEFPISGFLIFATFRSLWDDDNALLSSIEVQNVKIIRPANQIGPFPPHYLSFQKTPYPELQEDGTYQCSLGNKCNIMCMAVGDGITSISLRLYGQEEFPLKETFSSEIVGDVIKGGSAVVSEDSTGIDGNKYECRAENSQGMVISKTIEVSVILPTTIIQDRSNATITEEDETLRALDVICSAQGTPPLMVHFEIIQGTSFQENVTPDHVMYPKDNEILATKRVMYNDTSDPLWYQYTNFVKPSSVACIVNGNTTRHSSDYYDIPLPTD